MKYEVEITDKAYASLQKIKKSAPALLKKWKKLFLELEEHPRTGLGHPEALKGQGGNVYSRHLSAHDRIIYEIQENRIVVIVFAIEGHYDDK